MAVGFAFLVVKSDLGGGHDIALRLDGPGAKQHLPVSLAGRHGESRRVGQDIGSLLAENRAKLGKSKVVTLGEYFSNFK